MKTRTPLEKGYILHLSEHDLIIDDIIGFGGGSIVYNAHYVDRQYVFHRLRIKELFPQNTDCFRLDDGSLSGQIPEKYISRFKNAACVQKNIRLIDNLTNSTFALSDIVQTNNTLYSVMDYLNGICLNDLILSNIQDFLKIIYQVAKNIISYHENGFLHLDIKPENIYCLKTAAEYKALLFDFDSIINKSDLITQNVTIISSKGYSAPELTNKAKISEKSDYFSIGAIIFEKVFGRKPDIITDCSSFSDWDIDEASSILFGTDETFFNELCTFFKKTLCIYIEDRFETGEELLDSLKKLIDLSDVKIPYLEQHFSTPFNMFIGRTQELTQIEHALTMSNNVILSGLGGNGKSTLATQYAKIHKNEYDTIIFAQYSDSFTSLLCNDNIFSIANFSRKNGESDAKYYNRKMECFKSLCSSKLLLIIDNCNEFVDEQIKEWFNLPCKKIITTRSTKTFENAISIDIYGLNECKKLFYSFCTRKISDADNEVLEQIIHLISHHTLTTELISKLVNYTSITLSEIFHKFQQFEIQEITDERIKQSKDRQLNNRSIQNHIDALFDMSCFSEDEQNILVNLSVITINSIDIDLFLKWCGIYSKKSLFSLIERGLITEDHFSSTIALHPLIIDRVLNHLKPTVKQIDNLLCSLSEYINILPLTNDTNRMLTVKHRIDVCDHIIPRIHGMSVSYAYLLAQYTITRAQVYSSSKIIKPLLPLIIEGTKYIDQHNNYLLQLALCYLSYFSSKYSFEEESNQIDKFITILTEIKNNIKNFSVEEIAKAACLCKKLTYDYSLSCYFDNDTDAQLLWNLTQTYLLEAYNRSDEITFELKRHISKQLCDIYGDIVSPLCSSVEENKYIEDADNSIKIYIDNTLQNPDYYEKKSDLLNAMEVDAVPFEDILQLADEILAHWKSNKDFLPPYIRTQLISIYSSTADKKEIANELMIGEDNGYNYLQLAQNSLYSIPPKIDEAKKYARLSISYWKCRLSEDPLDNCLDIFKAYSLLLKSSINTAETLQSELIRETYKFLNCHFNTRDKEIANEFISLAKIYSSNKNIYITFASAFCEPDNFKLPFSDKKREITKGISSFVDNAKGWLPFGNIISSQMNKLSESMDEIKPEGYLYNELISNIIPSDDYTNKYYANLAIAEFFYENEISSSSIYYKNASENGKYAFGVNDYRTAYSMNRFDETTGSSTYASEINYYLLAKYEAPSHSYIYEDIWFDYINKYLKANRYSEAQTMATDIKNRINTELTHHSINILKNLCEYYIHVGAYTDISKCCFEALESCVPSNINTLCEIIELFLLNEKNSLLVSKMWDKLEQLFLSFSSKNKLKLAIAIITMCNSTNSDKHIYWLIKSQQIDDLPIDYKKNERINICDQLISYYEKIGDLENARKQTQIKNHLSPDGIYT